MATERSLATERIEGVTVRGDTPSAQVRAAAARLRMATLVFTASRRDLLATGRERLIRSLGISSAIFCLFFLMFMVLRPFRDLAVVRVVLPPPERTVILRELVPEPPAPSVESPKPDLEQLSVQKVADPPAPAIPEVIPPPPPAAPRVEAPRPVDRNATRAGEERAREATARLASSTAALDKSLVDLSASLRDGSGGSYQPTRRARTRNVRSGRADGQLAAVGNGLAGHGSSADLGGSTVEGSLVEIGSLSPARGAETRPATEGGTAAGTRPGVYRSNASLLAVIQKYAAGIQYCYESELKRDPGLRGKLVVALSVAAAGDVLEATVVQNTVGSQRMASCALSQIRSWKFPTIQGGLTTFQAPFVFTPPN